MLARQAATTRCACVHKPCLLLTPCHAVALCCADAQLPLGAAHQRAQARGLRCCASALPLRMCLAAPPPPHTHTPHCTLSPPLLAPHAHCLALGLCCS